MESGSMSDYVCGLMFSEDKEHVALIHKLKGPEEIIGKWNGIGGKIEESDDQPCDAMAREFLEETGVRTRWEEWTYFMELKGGDCPENSWTVYFFKCFSNKVFNVKTMEEEKVRTWPIRSKRAITEAHTVSNLDWIIPMALDERVSSSFIYEGE
jgi:8-oxo-dGTP diphosphatase